MELFQEQMRLELGGNFEILEYENESGEVEIRIDCEVYRPQAKALLPKLQSLSYNYGNINGKEYSCSWTIQGQSYLFPVSNQEKVGRHRCGAANKKGNCILEASHTGRHEFESYRVDRKGKI